MSAPASIPSASKSARGNNNGVDTLSSLPDELLHHMMSFLPMPEVMRTSLLSPRWRSLWASTPFIHIDCQDFKDENNMWGVDEDKLLNFGDHLLLLRDGAVCLDEARILIAPGVGGTRKSSVWVRHAIKHKVCILHLSGLDDYPFLDSTAMLPSQHLKIIRLRSLSLSHGFLKGLNYQCPGLEHLELVYCTLYDMKEISSRSLNTTMVYGHRLLAGLVHATTLELHAPLYEVALERGLQTCAVFSNLTSLVLGDWCMAADLYPLLGILQRSSKLKELIVKLKMEECSVCKDSESALSSSGGTLSSVGSYPSLERIKICCREDDPRIGALVQALLIFVRYGKISIECC